MITLKPIKLEEKDFNKFKSLMQESFQYGYETFIESFRYGFLLWTIVNLYDVIVLDIIWFCHDKYFVFKGTEDMVSDIIITFFILKVSL